jgi:hypothetical protein
MKRDGGDTNLKSDNTAPASNQFGRPATLTSWRMH